MMELVKVAVLSHYGFMRHEFDEEVAQLKLQLINSHTKHDTTIERPTSKISLSSAKEIWDIIKENKGLKVPPLRVMVATTRCDRIVRDKLRLLQSDQAWLDLQQNAKTQLVMDFGAQASSILTKYLSDYDKEIMNFGCITKGRYELQVDEVRNSKRQYLTEEALKVIHPAYMNTLGHLCSEALQSFKNELTAPGQKFSLSAVRTCRESCMRQFAHQCSDHATIEQAKWEDDVACVRQQLLREINDHALYQLRDELSTNLTTQVLKVIQECSGKDIWARVRRVIESESERAKSAAVGIFGAKHEQIVTDLEQYARNKVESSFKEASLNVDHLMKIRFIVASSKDGDTMDKEKPYRQCLDFLAAMAVIRLDDAYDVVQRVLHSELMGGVGISTEYLSSVTWEKVSHGVTLITPLECREIWTRFQTDMELHLAKTDAYKKALESNSTGKEGGAWTPPTWVILGLSVLGVTAFVGVLICYPEVVPALAISAALATGIAKQLKMNQGSPSLMEFLQKDLRRVYDCMTTVNDIAKLVVKNVA